MSDILKPETALYIKLNGAIDKTMQAHRTDFVFGRSWAVQHALTDAAGTVLIELERENAKLRAALTDIAEHFRSSAANCEIAREALIS